MTGPLSEWKAPYDLDALNKSSKPEQTEWLEKIAEHTGKIAEHTHQSAQHDKARNDMAKRQLLAQNPNEPSTTSLLTRQH